MKIKLSSLFSRVGVGRLPGKGPHWVAAASLLVALLSGFLLFRHDSLGAQSPAGSSAPGMTSLGAPGPGGLQPIGAALNPPGGAGSNTSLPMPHEMVVGEQMLQSRLSVVGTIEAGSSMNVTAPFDGVIQEKRVSFDSAVERDQVLLVLDSNEIRMRVQEAKVAMLKTAQALKDMAHWSKSPEVARVSRNAMSAKLTLAETQRKAAESEALLKRGIIPRAEYEALLEQLRNQEVQVATANDDLAGTLAKANPVNLQIARIEAENAAAKYQELMRSMENSSVKAPLAGVVSQAYNGSTPTSIDPGSRVTKGQALFNISALSQLGVTAKVDEADVTQLAQNQEVEIAVSSQDMPPLRGRISRISAQALPNSNGGARSALFEVKVEIPRLTEEELRRVRVGMSCNLSIVKYSNLHALVIPLPFVQQENGAPFTWVKGPDGKLQKRPVELGRTTESGIEVLKGLRPGERVVFRDKAAA
ncbi:MAG TPA: efflux RND transporter periplasmic adaptor subunit [Gallionella sp.]|nr:efflux RND transporter periplasmic adaptor subunit [Gallionella sp.]